MNILEVNQIKKIYSGKVNYTALEKVSFNLEKGEFVAIMGPSGSGKTTLLNCISTIDYPTGGEIIINDNNPHKLNNDKLAKFRRKELGFVFQDFNLVNTLTVEENIFLPLTLDNVSPKIMKEKLKDVAELLGIVGILKKRTFEISGGQAQRVAIARAIINEPSLLLADEPTGNLDSKTVKDVMNLFVSINKRMYTTILMVTHDAYVASFCNKVIFIKDGRLYNEINAGDSQNEFYEKIIDMLSFLGGSRK